MKPLDLTKKESLGVTEIPLDRTDRMLFDSIHHLAAAIAPLVVGNHGMLFVQLVVPSGRVVSCAICAPGSQQFADSCCDKLGEYVTERIAARIVTVNGGSTPSGPCERK